MTLAHGRVATRIPVQDLARARAWYSEKLGLEPAEERLGGLRYVCAGRDFALFESAGAASGDHARMRWEVDDFEATIAELRSRGATVEELGITEVEGNYQSKGGKDEKAAWFSDLDGNLFGIGEPIR